MTFTTSSRLGAYTDLINHPLPLRAAAASSPPQLLGFARALMHHAEELGELSLQSAWRLHRAHEERLTDRAGGLTPPGGWHGLASALSGTPLLHMGEDGFKPLGEPDSVELWTEAELKRALVESFTLYLVPPTTAAGYFLLLGLHPAWGLRIAHEARGTLGAPEGDEEPEAETIYDQDLFPAQHLTVIAHAVFASLSAILEALRTLDPDRAYRLSHMANLILEATRYARALIAQGTNTSHERALEPFIDHVTRHLADPQPRAVEFTTVDLFDHYLVPAGVAERFNDHTFRVWPSAIDERVRLFGHHNLGENRWLDEMLVEQVDALRAS